MDAEIALLKAVMQVISTIGFPIAICLILLWFIKDILEIVDEYSSIESDEDIIWKAKKGDSSYSTFNGHEWVDSKESFPGAIYYNKAGFDPKINTKSETKDYINITPSGFS